jgi:hypothetical protein
LSNYIDEASIVRVLFANISFNLIMLGLSTNLAAMAAPRQPSPIAQQPTGATVTPANDRQTVAGIGVEFILPNRFKAGSPANKQLQTLVSDSAKKSPITASFMTIYNDDVNYADAKAIAIDTAGSNLEIVLITSFSDPADLSLEAMQENFKRSKDMGNEFTPVDTKIISVGANRLLRIEGNLNIKGSQAKVLMGFIKAGDKTFQITYVYNSQNTPQATPVFEQIGSTFKVTARLPATTSPK